MPGGSHQAPILSCDPEEQLTALWKALAPERWPLPAALLPASALLVGGAVRDALLGRLRPRPDLDLVVEDDAIALTRRLAGRCGGSCVVLDAERSIARLVIQGWSFDLARRMGTSLDEDLARRDYSVNAIALPLATRPGAQAAAADGLHPQGNQGHGAPPPGNLAPGPIAPGGGLEDLRAGRMRALGEANLLEDPLRLLRGVRLACELGFRIEAQTLSWIRSHHQRLAEVAGERVLAELERLAAAADGAEGLRLAEELGLLRVGQPQPQSGEPPDQATGGAAGAAPSPERKNAWTAGLTRLTPEQALRRGLDAAEADLALPLARLASVLTPAALERLHASRRLQQRCRRLRQWLGRLEQSSALEAARAGGAAASGDGAIAGPEELTLTTLTEGERLALQQELEDDLPALLLHLEPGEARRALERWRDGADPLFHPRPPLDGRRLQEALGLPPGRTLGLLLAHLTRERAFGRLAGAGEPEQTLQAALEWLAERGEGAGAGEADGRRD